LAGTENTETPEFETRLKPEEEPTVQQFRPILSLKTKAFGSHFQKNVIK
jgi:hypothetical protein